MREGEIAQRQLSDYDQHRPGSCFEDPSFCLSIDEAYRLQFEVARMRIDRGEKILGYKIGCISKTMQKQIGIDHPVFGHVWNSESHSSGVTLDADNYRNLAIEGEFAIRLTDDVPSPDWLRQNPDVIEKGFVVIELHNYVFRGGQEVRACELIANNAIHAGVVMPFEETRMNHAGLLNSATIRVSKNNRVLGKSTLQNGAKTTLDGLIQLAEHLEKFDRCLLRGQIILTGSPLPLWTVKKGDLVEVVSNQLGIESVMKVAAPSTK
ncbi:MAG: hypothetical protein GY904_13210 [Planctomycetaceae bacterium]|nr:hypothetical protein [Planctomycetaceae bacterium]